MTAMQASMAARWSAGALTGAVRRATVGVDRARERATHCTLNDSRGVSIRPVRPDDASRLQALVHALSPSARRLRFHVSINHLPWTLASAMAEVDPLTQEAWVATAVAAPGAPVIADARWVRVPVTHAHTGGVAEFALMVADRWQRCGLGRLLLHRLCRGARLRGLRHLYGDVRTDNEPMLGLLRAMGATLDRHPDDAHLLRAKIALTPLEA